MSSNHENPAFKRLLQKLQEESWQLELLISGFAIFGLFNAIPAIDILVKEASKDQDLLNTIPLIVVYLSCYILIFNLLLHVVLRGLWIGSLGLRYVSGDINYEQLNYSEKFTNYLKKKIGSFDKYISTLENYCSIIFAISFMLIFYVLAVTFSIITIVLTAEFLIDNDSLPAWLSKGVGIPILIFIVLGIFLTFIDFITQGWLKKKRWLSKIYFPVYWIFSFITLSFLYRPLVYNFLDNKFGKRLSFVLVPIYFIIVFLTSIQNKKSNYISVSNASTSSYASKNNYENMLTEEGEFIRVAAIPSKVIKNSYLKVFMVYTDQVENRIFKRNKDLKPKKDERGLNSSMISFSYSNKKESLTKLYLKEFNKIYDVMIDSIVYPSEFILSESSTKELGFETYIDIKGLSKGKHTLYLQRDSYNSKDTTVVQFATIPFWYFNDSQSSLPKFNDE